MPHMAQVEQEQEEKGHPGDFDNMEDDDMVDYDDEVPGDYGSEQGDGDVVDNEDDKEDEKMEQGWMYGLSDPLDQSDTSDVDWNEQHELLYNAEGEFKPASDSLA